MEMNDNDIRVKWIDSAKFIGIFAIYLGHIESVFFHDFCFAFHVQLFFFLSGCTAALKNMKSPNRGGYCAYVSHLIKSLLLPTFIFGMISIFIRALLSSDFCNVYQNILILFKGPIRNTFPASSLWFFSCLFIVSVVFEQIRRLGLIAVTISIPCCMALSTFIYRNTNAYSNVGIYNYDAALYYWVFFALGYLVFMIFEKLHNEIQRRYVPFISVTIFVNISTIIMLVAFWGNKIGCFILWIRPLMLILIVCSICVFMKKVPLQITEIGMNTKYFCLGEDFAEIIIPTIVGLFGLSINMFTPFHSIIYTILVLVFCKKIVVPVEKKIIECIVIHPSTYPTNKSLQ